MNRKEGGAGHHVLGLCGPRRRRVRRARPFDLDREHNRHIAFGAGPHRCVGSNVARMNLRVAIDAIDEIVRRLADVRLKPGADIGFHSAFNRAPVSVPARL